MTHEEIIAKATKMVEMGSKMSFDKIVAMYEKKELSKSKRLSKTANKMADRKQAQKELEGQKERFFDTAEMNKYYASKNLPSSMR